MVLVVIDTVARTRIQVTRTYPKLTDSQRFLQGEERKLLTWVEEEAGRRREVA